MPGVRNHTHRKQAQIDRKFERRVELSQGQMYSRWRVRSNIKTYTVKPKIYWLSVYRRVTLYSYIDRISLFAEKYATFFYTKIYESLARDIFIKTTSRLFFISRDMFYTAVPNYILLIEYMLCF